MNAEGAGVPGDRPRMWVLSRGSYSDYRVVAAFATKRLAQAAKKAALNTPTDYYGASDCYEVESLPYFTEAPQIVTTYTLQAEISDDGSVAIVPERSLVEWEFDQLYHSRARPHVRFVRAPVHRDKGGRLEVRGTDKQAVEQAFSDNVARIRLNAETTGKAGPQVNV